MLGVFETLADKVTYGLLGLGNAGHFSEAVHFFVEDITKIFALAFGMIFIVGVLRTWVSADAINRWLGQKAGYSAYLVAVLLGALTPFCSCSSIPLFIAFTRAGIPLGVAMAFLITSPMVNEVAVVLFAEAVGWKFSLAYSLTGMATGLVGGLLADRFGMARYLKPLDGPGSGIGSAGFAGFSARLRHAWVETLGVFSSVGHYMVIGVAVGAAIHGYVPQDMLLAYAGTQNIWAVPMAILAGIPLYASCTGMVPVADALISKGLPVGTTLAFIMSTAAISLPEIMMLSRLMGARLIGWFLAYLVVAFTIVGYAFNAFY